MSSKPKIIFDTTAINRLEDSGTDSEPLMRGLESGYLLCLTAKRRRNHFDNQESPAEGTRTRHSVISDAAERSPWKLRTGFSSALIATPSSFSRLESNSSSSKNISET